MGSIHTKHSLGHFRERMGLKMKKLSYLVLKKLTSMRGISPQKWSKALSKITLQKFGVQYKTTIKLKRVKAVLRKQFIRQVPAHHSSTTNQSST